VEPRSDSTWLFVGLGVGCGLVLVMMSCVLAGVFLYAGSRARGGSTSPTPPPATSVAPPPPSTTLPPLTGMPSIPPPTTTLVPVDPTDDRAPRAVSATIQTVTGTPGVSVGQTCEFNVERRDRDDGSGFWCNAQIVCGGHLLYGGPTAGFFPCTLFSAPGRGVVGSDPNTTASDQDAAMAIDTVQSHLEIWDDAQGANGEFRVVAHIDSVQ
jgi:hypothetical protein